MTSPPFVPQLILSSFVFILQSAAMELPDSTQNLSNEEVRKISGLLIAPCCWSMTADAHSSEIAHEMRAQIRTALAEGKNEKEILQAYVAQYGERILAKPTKQGFNLLAWILPFVALVIGGLVLWRFLHRHAEPAPGVMAADPNDPYAQRMEQELKEFDQLVLLQKNSTRAWHELVTRTEEKGAKLKFCAPTPRRKLASYYPA
jgi:cytochrome c-type biogenesis protein CcmH